MPKDLMIGEDAYHLQTEILGLLPEHPKLIFALKNKYADDHAWDVALEADPSIFAFYKDPEYNDCLKAVLLDGRNIQYVPYRNLTYEICVTSIRSFPRAILLIPREKLDMRMIQQAVDLDPSLIKEYEDELDGFYIEDKIKEMPELILSLNHPDDDCIVIAIDANPGLMFKMPKEWWTETVKKEIRETHPDWDSYIPN